DGIGCLRLAEPDAHRLQFEGSAQAGSVRWAIVRTAPPTFAIQFGPTLRLPHEQPPSETPEESRTWSADWGEYTSDPRSFVLEQSLDRVSLKSEGQQILNVRCADKYEVGVTDLPDAARPIPGIYLLTWDSRMCFRHVRA